jgi:pilus assembly protein CpaB
MNTRRTTLLVAILLAIGTGWLTLNYVNSLKRSSAQSTEQRTVVVAAADIPARTTITPAMLQRTTRPADAVEPDAITDPSIAAGQLSLISIPAGSQISSSKIGRPGSVGLPVQLSPGKRAVSIQVDKVKGISGLIQPGDRVDVIAIPPRQNNEPPAAVTILRGIKVLAVGTSLETSSATPSPEESASTTVTLEVSPQQADLVAMADINTNLRLSLRSPRESINSEPTEALHFAPAAPVQVATVRAPAPAPAPAKPLDPPKASHTGIMIIDGDHIGYSGDAHQ